MLQHRGFLYALACVLLLLPITVASRAFADATLLPYAATGYRFMQYSSETPFPEGIESPSFDESGFGTGQGAFGSSTECSEAPLNTSWDAGTKLAVRGHFQGGSSPTGVRLHFGIDNDVVIYINGTQVASVSHEDCAGYDDFVVDVPSGLVQEGDNLIVALCVDRGNIAWFDMSVTGDDHPPTVSAPATINGEERGTLTINVTASDPNGDPIDALTADVSELPEGNDATFTPNGDNTQGTLVWHMQPGDAGDYHIRFTATSTTLTGSDTTYVGVVPYGADATGIFNWTPQAGQEGTYFVTFTATDAGGTSTQTDTLNISPPIIILSPVRPSAGAPTRFAAESPERTMKGPIIQGTGTTIGGSTGTAVQTTVSATTDAGGSASSVGTHLSARITKAGSSVQDLITLSCDTSGLPAGNDASFAVDEQPQVTSPGVVPASPGAPVTVLVTAVDPDGDAIESLTADTSGLPAGNQGTFTAGSTNQSGTFSWTPTLADAGGSYVVTFAATNRMVGTASTTIQVSSSLAARIFIREPVYINIGSNRGANCLYIEPVSGAFQLSDVDLSTLRLISSGTGAVSEIGSIQDKTVVIDDRDNNHVLDLEACFAKDDLRMLFSLLSGKSVHPITIRGQLTTGAFFEGTAQVTVIANGKTAAASVAPNPLNPQAKLSFTLVKAGWLKVSLYDSQGRLTRVLADETRALPGPRDITVDGTDGQGRPLASGVYYYKVQSADGVIEGKLAIVR